MKRIVAIIVVLLVVASLQAQAWKGNLRLTGTVVDQKSGEPVKDAIVKLRIQSAGSGGPDVKADAKGKWAVLGLGTGGWNIDVEAPGYLTRQLSIALKANDRR